MKLIHAILGDERSYLDAKQKNGRGAHRDEDVIVDRAKFVALDERGDGGSDEAPSRKAGVTCFCCVPTEGRTDQEHEDVANWAL